VSWSAYVTGDRIHTMFLGELQELFKQRHEYWGQSIEGEAAFELELHDVQFQLCEMDKYERERLKPGAVRVYEPPSTWAPAPSAHCSAAFGGCWERRADPRLASAEREREAEEDQQEREAQREASIKATMDAAMDEQLAELALAACGKS
ncbi:unnamed protein product, partial [Polarella glacialis]